MNASLQSNALFLNMSGNLPPKVPHVFNDAYRGAVGGVLADFEPNDLIGAHQFRGSERDRCAGARFVARRLSEMPAPDRIVVANGTQSILLMLLASLVGRGRRLALESLSYPTLRSFADHLGFDLSPVPMDEEGALPDAFEAICRADRPAAYYAMPTLQNPTTGIMSVVRRQAIAEICRRYGIAIIEDDIYSLLPRDMPLPLSTFAPELSWYILGTAKSLAAALKVAYVVAPTAAAAAERFWPGVRATYWMCAPMNGSVVSKLIEIGHADRIIEAVRAETRARQAIVAERLAGADLRTRPDCLHVWLSLPDSRPASDFVSELRALGVEVSTSSTYAMGDTRPPNAIRFGMGTPRDRADFERGLNTITKVYFK
ncbi:DNA-binding transcriptional MocR family regulator [Bradyrhizobium macuxiense]|uniref:DNA-binding transcriptional MocR family regulator n=1 Tax=Bradyrhizobium macuxiense TaxID=1755647 RepID=A0A560KVL9_9BRAD|nr:PLP-dependent aminotransferase family protein [Bradyrhizobium macuxiense]TWB87255.1 DNA-binding transcriptional MocR family regulator [Bradyrhizobium macuxiense]